jgi:hypothetical protein
MAFSHVPLASVNDQLIAPTPFSAEAGQSGEEFLNHFKRYCLFKNFTREQQADLFGLLLRGAPGQWHSTLPADIRRNPDELMEAFQKAYFPNANLVWQDTQQLLNATQLPNESVTAFIARLRHISRRLHITPQTLHHALIAGLRPSVRQFVVTQGGLTDLETAIEVAQRAEAGTDADPMTKILLSSVESQTRLAESQNKRMDELVEQFQSMVTRHEMKGPAAAMHDEHPRRDRQSDDRNSDRGRSRDREDNHSRPRRYSSDYSRSRNAIIVHRNDALLRRRHSVRSAKITSVSRQAKHRLSFNLAERPHPLAGKHVEGADMYTNRAIVEPVAPPAERAENLTISRSNAAPREIGDIDGTAHVGRLALIQPTPCLSLEYQKMKLACLLT